LRLVILSDGDRRKQWLTSPETLSCFSCMLTGQLRIFSTTLSTDRYIHSVSNWGKTTTFAEKQHLLEESNMADGAPKSVINVCMHKFACTNVTPKRRNGAHFITRAPYYLWVIILRHVFRKYFYLLIIVSLIYRRAVLVVIIAYSWKLILTGRLSLKRAPVFIKYKRQRKGYTSYTYITVAKDLVLE